MADRFSEVTRFIFVILALTFALRLPSLFYAFLDVDESQFAGFAHVLMDGGRPYLDSLDTKPPFIYLFYQAVFSLFGKYNMTALHGVMIVWHAAVALVVWMIGRKTGNERIGRWAAIFYTVFSVCHLPKYLSASITAVMILPLALSVLAWLVAERGRRALFLVSGVCAGAAFLCKYQAGIQIVVFAAFLGWQIMYRKITWQAAVTRYGIFTLGFAAPIVLTLLWLQHLGVIPDFVRWSLQGSAHYIGAGTDVIPFWKNLALRGGFFVLCTALLWHLLVHLGPRLRPLIGSYPHLPLILSWFALSIVPVATGGRFYGHYFLQLLPPLCLVAAFALPHPLSTVWKRYVVFAMIVPALVFSALRWDFRRVDAAFPDDQIFEQETIGHWLKDNTGRDATLFVWGFATAIYFHSELKPASRFLWTDLLTGKVPGSALSNDPAFDTSQFIRPEAWTALWEDFAKTKPDYFVDTSPPNIHNYGKYPLDRFPELKSMIDRDYVLLAEVKGARIYKKVNP
jgi:4-amino-4-deoxy-L-arabinose transferase-like glycosyltransferase